MHHSKIDLSRSGLGRKRPGRTMANTAHVRYAAGSGSKFRAICAASHCSLMFIAVNMIQAPKLEPRIAYELSDCEWTTIKPMLPNTRA